MANLNYPKQLLGSLLLAFLFTSCNNHAPATVNTTPAGGDSLGMREETIAFRSDSANLQAFVVYNDSVKGRRPAVIVLPEWWGLNDYPKKRARMLAQLGYVAMALDLFGDGRVAATPDSAKAYTAPFYKDPLKAKRRVDSAIAKLKTYDIVDTAEIGAIGYCFGGGVLLNAVRLGDDLKAAVSFHGTLLGTPARKGLVHTKILVCHGNADKFVTPPMVAEFKKQMDSIGADYTFIGYDSATHAFTNPDADKYAQQFHMPIAYNPKADTASWTAMAAFFKSVFGR